MRLRAGEFADPDLAKNSFVLVTPCQCFSTGMMKTKCIFNPANFCEQVNVHESLLAKKLLVLTPKLGRFEHDRKLPLWLSHPQPFLRSCPFHSVVPSQRASGRVLSPPTYQILGRSPVAWLRQQLGGVIAPS